MPIYKLINKNTGEEKNEYFTSYCALEEYLKDNDHIITGVPDKLNISTGTNISSFKNDDSFKDLLKTIKKTNPNSKMEVN